MLILVLIHQQLQLQQMAVNPHLLLMMTIVMMKAIMKIVNGMVETVVVIMSTHYSVSRVNV